MKLISLLVSLAAIILLISCAAPIKSTADFNTSTDFQKYKSYAWIGPDDSILSLQQLKNMYGDLIMNLSNDELKKKGMVLDTENPDALFLFDMGASTTTSYSQAPTLNVGVGYHVPGAYVGRPGYYGGGYYIGGYMPVSGGEITSETTSVAFLNVVMFDTKSGELLWTCTAKKTMDNKGDLKENFKLALQYIFAKLPAKNKSK